MDRARIGRYRLERRVAVGGMAEVYAAVVEGADGFEKPVAVKRILPHLAADPEFVAMFRNEARIASRLGHANVAQVFDFGEVDGILYLVMEWVDGRDLRRVLTAAREAGLRLGAARTAHLGREVARALAHAHGATDAEGRPLGLVHRDVSPQNVLLTWAGEVKLADFGIAKAVLRSSRTAVGVLKGKCAYMSPEQARGDPVDGRSDLFSLGVVLWEALAGRPLFRGDTDFETLKAVQHETVPPPSAFAPDVPPALDALVARCLARAPADRFGSAAELDFALADVLLRCAGSARDWDLADLMRRLFADELAERARGTRRLAAPAPPTPPPPRAGVPPAPAAPTATLPAPAAAPRGPLPGRWLGLAAAVGVAGGLGAWGGLGFFGGAESPATPPADPVTAEAGAGKPVDPEVAADPAPAGPAPEETPAPAAEAPSPPPASAPVREKTARAEAGPATEPSPRPAPPTSQPAAAPVRPTRPPPDPTPAPPGGARVIRRLAPAAAPDASPAGAPPPAVLAAGHELQARLRAGLEAAGPAPVEAEVVVSVVAGGKVVLPRGTRLHGTARPAPGGFALAFDRLTPPSGRAVSLRGRALAPDGAGVLEAADALRGDGARVLPEGTRFTVRLEAPLSL